MLRVSFCFFKQAKLSRETGEFLNSEVVQLVERFAVNEVVAGSNPALRAKKD